MARYSGICWYLANSAAQSAADSGGTMPITGFHSVIDRPERVSRVMPPTTTIRKIKPQQKKSHAATGRRPASAAARGATPELATPAVEIGKDRSSKYAALDVVRASRRAPAPPHRSSERVNRLRIFGGLAGCSEPKWCYCVALGRGLWGSWVGAEREGAFRRFAGAAGAGSAGSGNAAVAAAGAASAGLAGGDNRRSGGARSSGAGGMGVCPRA